MYHICWAQNTDLSQIAFWPISFQFITKQSPIYKLLYISNGGVIDNLYCNKWPTTFESLFELWFVPKRCKIHHDMMSWLIKMNFDRFDWILIDWLSQYCVTIAFHNYSYCMIIVKDNFIYYPSLGYHKTLNTFMIHTI